MNRAAVLREVMVRAANACLWAEENSVWHAHTSEALDHMRARQRAQTRVERVLSRATKDDLLDGPGQCTLIGLVLDAMRQVRMRHEPRGQDQALTLPLIEQALEANIREMWSRCVRQHWWRRAA
jgi:hypothetical protein